MTNYEWYKSKGICPMCGKEKAARGRIHCLNCLDYLKYDNELHRSEQSKEQRRQYVKRKRDLCIAFGICRECMCREATVGNYCSRCKTKIDSKNFKKNNKRLVREYANKCYFCGKDRADGYKVCLECLGRLRKITKTRKKADNSNHIWRKIQSEEVKLCIAYGIKRHQKEGEELTC